MNKHEERLRAMLCDGQQTWDLSPNDIAAIRWAVDRMNELAARLASAEAALRVDLSPPRRGMSAAAYDHFAKYPPEKP